MNIRQAQQIARNLGISIRSTGHGKELRVSYSGRGNEPSACYTNCLSDACATAQHMADHASLTRLTQALACTQGRLTPPAPVA